MILHVVWGPDLRHLYVEGSFTDLTCAAFVIQVPLRGLGGNFWKTTINPLHFSEYIGGAYFQHSRRNLWPSLDVGTLLVW